jgi:hypothetical protein
MDINFEGMNKYQAEKITERKYVNSELTRIEYVKRMAFKAIPVM